MLHCGVDERLASQHHQNVTLLSCAYRFVVTLCSSEMIHRVCVGMKASVAVSLKLRKAKRHHDLRHDPQGLIDGYRLTVEDPVRSHR